MKSTRGGAVAATPSVPSGGTVRARRKVRKSRMLHVIAVGLEEPSHAAVRLEPAKEVFARLRNVDEHTATGELDEVREGAVVLRRGLAHDRGARAQA